MLYTVCWGFIFLRYVVCGIWLIVCHLRVSLFKVSLVVWLMFACFCSYWNNWNLLSHYFNVMCFEVEGRCGMEWRRVQSLRWWIAAHRRGVPITVHLERGVSQKRQNRLTYGTSGKHELSTEDCIFYFFFRMGGRGGFGKLRHSLSRPHVREKWASHHRRRTQGSDEGQDRRSLRNLCSYTQGPLTLAGHYCGHLPQGRKKGKFDLKMTGSVSTSVTVFINGLNSCSFSRDIELPRV